MAEQQQPKNPDLEAAEIAKTKAETAKLEAETRQAIADAAIAEAKAEIAHMDLDTHRKIVADEQATDDEHRVYQFGEQVSAASVKSCIKTLARWHRLDPGCDITLVFNSPGGSVIDGFALWDYLSHLKREGHHLTTICQGMAASMGGILFMAGNKRVMGAESVILVHEISFGAGGKIGDVEDSVEFAKMLAKRVLNIFAARTNLTAKQIDNRWKRKDWWMDSDEALKLGFCDEIR
jgi:ATP-dependent Clp endopeptidase proteolytic subunit ClpP